MYLESDEKDLADQNIQKVDYVVCNLYPFKETIAKINVTIPEAVEEYVQLKASFRSLAHLPHTSVMFHEQTQFPAI